MIWLYLLLGLLAFFLLFFYLLHFEFSLTVSYPEAFRGSFRFSFLWFRHGGAFGSARGEPSAPSPGSQGGVQGPPDPSGGLAAAASRPEQAGFLRLPTFSGWRKRLKLALFKLGTDPGVLRSLVRFGLRCLGFFRRMLGARLSSLSFGAEDPAALGRFAGAYSAAAGLYPFLRCPVYFYFNQRRLTFGLRVRGKFTGLHILAALVKCFLAFPWFSLLRHFWAFLRDTRLNWWQARIYAQLGG